MIFLNYFRPPKHRPGDRSANAWQPEVSRKKMHIVIQVVAGFCRLEAVAPKTSLQSLWPLVDCCGHLSFA